MRVMIESNRNGYKPEQCGKTLTVRELIEQLQGYDEDAKVYISNDEGNTFGSLNQWSITGQDEDEEVGPVD